MSSGFTGTASVSVDDIRLEALRGNLVELYKLRIGDYRVIYEIIHDERTIVIHAIGHRRDIYRKR